MSLSGHSLPTRAGIAPVAGASCDRSTAVLGKRSATRSSGRIDPDLSLWRRIAADRPSRRPAVLAALLRWRHRGPFPALWRDIARVSTESVVLREGFERYSPVLRDADKRWRGRPLSCDISTDDTRNDLPSVRLIDRDGRAVEPCQAGAADLPRP